MVRFSSKMTPAVMLKPNKNITGADVNELWYQEDGATCHITYEEINLLKATFVECIILCLRRGLTEWAI